MNLFLRLLIVFAKARFKRRLDLIDEFDTHFRVWLTDQDMFRHVTNSRFFSLTDIAIVDYLLRTGASKMLRRRRWMPVVVYEDLVFRKALRFPQKFLIRTRFLGWNDDYVFLRHAFVRGETTVAEGVTVARFISRRGEKIPTASIVEELDPGRASPPLPDYALEALHRTESGYGRSEPPADVSEP